MSYTWKYESAAWRAGVKDRTNIPMSRKKKRLLLGEKKWKEWTQKQGTKENVSK